VLASVLIAAAGYIINDYFDINIDAVNKPEKLVVDKIIGRRWAIILHILLSLAGIAISFYLDIRLKSYWLGLANTLCVFLLFGYSIALKKKLLIGNVLISALTAWVIMVVYFSVQFVYTHSLKTVEIEFTSLSSLTRISLLYAGFAFVISLIREVIKDMEDRDGDARYGCKTMPIVWGIPVSKVFTAVWLVVLMAAICIVQLYVLPFGWWASTFYGIVLILLPLGWILRKLYSCTRSP
jgi:4-hydroxybenzoate polyprenyltransferase